MKYFIKLSAILLVVFNYSEVNAKAYFDGTIIAPNIIDTPLKVGTKEWDDEIKTIISLQKNADKEELRKAQDERDLRPETVAQAVDKKLTRRSYPALYELLDNAGDTSYQVCNNAKNYWKTTRPYLSDKRIKVLIKAHSNNSYPSGHTAGSYVTAYILGQLIPNKRQEFLSRANEIANHRILVGMHYPHDIKGGKQLALLTIGALFENDDFVEDFTKAKEELAKKELKH